MAHNPSRKRDKPLRTYGKRSVSTPEPRGEPPLKRARRKSDEPAQDEDIPVSTLPEPTSKGQTSEQARTDDQSSAQSVKGGTRKPLSILSYFKPITPREEPASSGNTTDGPKEPPSPLPLSASRPKRKPRLLRLRATSSPPSDAPEDTTDGRKEDADKEQKHSGGEENYASNSNNKARGSPLRDGGGNRLNQTKEAKTSDETGPSGTAKKKKKAPTVQMTLNISAQAAFAECKICDVVWNPLYPDDVKYHLKRHATVLRAKRKQEDGL